MGIYEAIGTGIVIFCVAFTVAGMGLIVFFGLRSLKESHEAGRAFEYGSVMKGLDPMKDFPRR